MSHVRIYYFLKIRTMTDTVALHEISKLILKSLFFAFTLKEFYMFTSVSLNFHYKLVFQEAIMSIIILVKRLQGNFSILSLIKELHLLEILL